MDFIPRYATKAKAGELVCVINVPSTFLFCNKAKQKNGPRLFLNSSYAALVLLRGPVVFKDIGFPTLPINLKDVCFAVSKKPGTFSDSENKSGHIAYLVM